MVPGKVPTTDSEFEEQVPLLLLKRFVTDPKLHSYVSNSMTTPYLDVVPVQRTMLMTKNMTLKVKRQRHLARQYAHGL